MKHITKTLWVCFLLFLSAFSGMIYAEENPGLADGPYIFHLTDGGIRVVSVNVDSTLIDTIYKTLPVNFALPVKSHDGKHTFDVKLHKFQRQNWKSSQPGKLMVISDPHGNMDCFVSVLRGNNVINEKYEWIYGANHLIINGDVFDRGKNVLPIFWLIYKLEREAEEAGGQVSFLIGNHEPMILAGDYRYANEMYLNLAERINMDYREFFGSDTELGRWLTTRNSMQIIGDDLFVHAGLGKVFLEANLTIPQVNEGISAGLFMTKQERKEHSELTEFLFGSLGPIWYRGMVRNDEKYDPLHTDVLGEILQRYGVKRVVVGHTIFPDIRVFYSGRVVTVNVDNKKNFDAVLGRGILIEKDNTYVISDKEILRKLDF